MRAPTVSKLRDDIDRGRTGDKVAWPDPAAAPLGTDEEAAGTPIPPEAVAQAHAYELAGASSTGQGAADPNLHVVRTAAYNRCGPGRHLDRLVRHQVRSSTGAR